MRSAASRGVAGRAPQAHRAPRRRERRQPSEGADPARHPRAVHGRRPDDGEIGAGSWCWWVRRIATRPPRGVARAQGLPPARVRRRGRTHEPRRRFRRRRGARDSAVHVVRRYAARPAPRLHRGRASRACGALYEQFCAVLADAGVRVAVGYSSAHGGRARERWSSDLMIESPLTEAARESDDDGT